jgi:hypothetical protein
MSARMVDHFNGMLETQNRPCLVTTQKQLYRTNHYKQWLNSSNRQGGLGNPSKEHGVKCRNVLSDLP